MMIMFAKSMLGWMAMVMFMGYFIWQEMNQGLELETEEEEPPSSRLAVPVTGL